MVHPPSSRFRSDTVLVSTQRIEAPCSCRESSILSDFHSNRSLTPQAAWNALAPGFNRQNVVPQKYCDRQH
jgi:hypothetical protein